MDDIPLATVTGDVTIEDTEVQTAPHSVKCVSSGSLVYAEWQPCEDKLSYVIGLHMYPQAGAEIYFTRDDTAAYIYSLRYNDSNETWDLYQADALIQGGTKTVPVGDWSLIEIVAYLGDNPFSGNSFNHIDIRDRKSVV